MAGTLASCDVSTANISCWPSGPAWQPLEECHQRIYTVCSSVSFQTHRAFFRSMQLSMNYFTMPCVGRRTLCKPAVFPTRVDAAAVQLSSLVDACMPVLRDLLHSLLQLYIC